MADLKETLADLGGTVASVTISAEMRSTGNTGRFASLTVSLSPDADLEQITDAVQHWAEERSRVEYFDMDAPIGPVEAEEFDKPDEDVDYSEGGIIDVAKYKLTERTDGKMQLELYPLLKNGNVGEWPDIKDVRDKDAMRKLLKGLNGLAAPPAEKIVQWQATYEYGRKKPKGKGRYKDLKSVRPA